jgi:kelch-like protein 2/3
MPVSSAGLSTVEAYNSKTDEWFHVLPMSTRRSSVGVGVVNGDYMTFFFFLIA